MIANKQDRDQLSSQPMTWLECSTFTKSQIPSALIRQLTTKPSATVGGAALGMSADNLVDTLSAQPEVVGDLREGLPPKASLTNLSVPFIFATRSGAQRSPLPPGKHLQGTAPIWWKFTFTMPLPRVIDPVSKPQGLVGIELDVGCRDSAVALSNSELVERTDMQEELLRMIHASTIVGEGYGMQPSTLRWWKGLRIDG